MRITRYFVYEPSMLGPVACIWHDKRTDGNGKDQLTIGKPIALHDEDKRTIEELKKDYPCGDV